MSLAFVLFSLESIADFSIDLSGSQIVGTVTAFGDNGLDSNFSKNYIHLEL